MSSPEITNLFGDVERVTKTAESLNEKVANVMSLVSENGPHMAIAGKDLLGSTEEVLRETRLMLAQAENIR